MDLKNKIRNIPNWPMKGINFKDITPLLLSPKDFKYVINNMIKPFLHNKIDKVVAVDARGFLLASPIAYKISSGIAIVRKKGKLPFKTIDETYQKEYGTDTLCMHTDAIKKGDNVLIVDDLLATGGTLLATTKLIERLGGKIIGITVIINLGFLPGSKKLKKYNLKWLVEYDKE